ncbi:MAG: YggS family pyridoxal phosphate-dependent enzyme [Fibrobacter sp.]|nr:YggS family pyridoxal phosphate-dependent enzyme [Fibrobacter sp.]
MNTGLKTRLENIQARIGDACRRSGRDPQSVELVAVTKTHDFKTVQALIDLGVRTIGENRVQEILQKMPHLRGDFRLHMIGHLQTNKVGPVLEYAQCIQSIDREKLVKRIEDLITPGKKMDVLIEVNTSGEESKSGCAPQECRQLCERVIAGGVVQLKGFMTVGPISNDESRVRRAFSLLRTLSEQCSDLLPHAELSMGMSGDFEWAIAEGSTMVRVGSLLLGERNYNA